MASTLEAIRKKITELKVKSGQFFKLKTGQNLLRFVPWDPNEPFYFESRQHFIPWGGARGTGIGTGCLEPTGKSCPACVLAEKLIDSDDPKKQSLGKQLQAHSRYFYCVVDLKDPESGVQVFQSYSDVILRELCTHYADPDCGDFTDPATGRNVLIEKTDKGKAAPPSYSTKVKMKSTKLEGWKTLRKQVKNLKRLAPAPDAKQMKELISQFKTGGSTSGDMKAVTEGLPCFGHSYKKLPDCPRCAVRARCKVVTRSKSAKMKVRGKMKKRVGAG